MKTISLLSLLGIVSLGIAAEPSNTLKLGWSPFPSWNMNELMQMRIKGKPSMLDKRMAQYNGHVKIEKFKEYTPSCNAVATESLDAVTCTIQEAMSIIVDAGVPVRIVMVYDYSDKADALIVPKGTTLADMKGANILAEEGSISQLLGYRFLEINKLPPTYFNFLHTPGDDVPKFMLPALAKGEKVYGITWNPHVERLKATGKVDILFDSSKIPMEIVDVLVIREDKLKGRENALKAYLAAYFDAIAFFKDPKTKEQALYALCMASELPESDMPLMGTMMTSIHLYDTVAEMKALMSSGKLKETQTSVKAFLKNTNLFKGKNPESYNIPVDSSFLPN